MVERTDDEVLEVSLRYPEEVSALAITIEQQHPENPAEAIEALKKAVRKLSYFKDLQEAFFHSAMQRLVYEKRHHHNVTERRSKEGRKKANRPKVVLGNSEEVNKAAEKLSFLYRIGSTTIGAIKGKELLPMADNLEKQASGVYRNASLLRALAPLVGEDQTVKSAVSLKKLNQLWNKAG